MNQLPDYETAQRRIADRQRRRNAFYIWLVAFAMLVLFGILASGKSLGCLFLIAGLVGLIAAVKGSDVYFDFAHATDHLRYKSSKS